MKQAKRRKLLAILLTVAMTTSMLPMLAIAADTDGEGDIMLTEAGGGDTATLASGTCGATGSENSITWKLTSNNDDPAAYTLTISGSGAMADFTSSSEAPWREYRSSITSVIISEGITRIGNRAFLQCGALVSVSMPDSVTSIGNAAFNSCEKLTSLIIGKGVISIDAWAFNNMYALENFAVAEGNTAFLVDNYGVLYAKANDDNTTNLTLQSSPKAKTGSYTVPDSIDGMNVTAIGTAAFAHCSWESVTISNNVTSLGNYAFVGNEQLTTVSLSDKITAIGSSTFYEDSKLSSIILPDSVTSIGSGAFASCTELTSINTNKVIDIGGQAFNNCTGLTTVTIGDGTTIANSAFSSCTALTHLTLGEGCNIGQAFQNCTALKSVTIPAKTTVGYYAFNNCTNLTEVTFEGKVAPASNFPSSGTENLIKLNQSAFAGCTALVKATFEQGSQNAGKQGTSTTTTYENYLILCIQKDNKATWYKADGTVYTRWNYNCNSNPCELSDNDVIYAVYTSAIEFEGNGGVGNVSSIDSYYAPGLADNATLTISSKTCTLTTNSFTREGYEFAGWNTEADGAGVAFDDGAAVPISNQQITKLYAQWTKKVGEEDSKYTVNAIPNQTYTGAAIEPVVVVKNDGTVLTSGYTVSYSDNTNVGTAKVTVTIGTDSAEVEFQITKDNNTAVELADVSVTYGTPYTMTATARTSAGNEIKDGTITVKYYTDEACTEGETETPPTNAGTYYAKATLTGTDNYAEAGKIAKITISNADFSVNARGYDGVYDGQEHSINVEADGAEVTYSTDGTNYSETNPSFTDAGTYTVYYKAEKANYNDVTGSVNVTISRAEQAISFTSGALTEHISAATATNTLNHTAGDGAVTYSSSNEEVAAVDADGQVTIKGVGETTITAAAAGTNNYNEAEASYTLTVEEHTYGEDWKSDENGHWQECAVCGEKTTVSDHTFQWIIDKEATTADKGSKHEECSVCHYKKEAVEIPATGKPADNKPGENKPGDNNNAGGNTGNSTKVNGASPKTGDTSQVGLWISLLVVSLLGIGAALLTWKKQTYRGKWMK